MYWKHCKAIRYTLNILRIHSKSIENTLNKIARGV